MLGHDRWATSQLLTLSAGLSDDQLDQEFDIGVRSMRETLDHLVYVIDFWTSQMQARPAIHERRTQHYDRSVAALAERHERFHAGFEDFAQQAVASGRLDETFVDHYGYRQSIGATILQVLHHNAQHRSEARHMLERLGLVDLWDYDPQEWEHAAGIISNERVARD